VDKKIRIAAIIGALAFSVIILTSPSAPPPIPPPTFNETGNESIEILATNLKKPWALEIVDQRIFITEKGGNIRVFHSDILDDTSLAIFRTAEVFGGGLLGIVAHPEFETNHFLYVYYTYVEDGKLWNKILRIKEFENKLQDSQTILDKIPGSEFSNGGVLKFGPDGKLYVGTGAGLDSSHASQDMESLAGKILRLNDDGTFPKDNPFSNSPVYSIGHSNPQGIAWDESANLYVTELGPSKNDEINLIIPGKNYGWPEQQCSGDKKFEDSMACYDPSIEPGGIIFYSGDKLDFQNNMIMAALGPQKLDQLEINENGLISQHSIMSGLGRIRDIAEGPDGYLYLITSNTDGRAFPDSDDDKLVRILK
jgi:glucose/arabinose dehydrogenase